MDNKKLQINIESFLDTELSLADQYTLVDTVMQIPIDRMKQIQIYIYEYKSKQYLDIRQYRYSNNLKVFQQTRKGVRIPIEFLPQLLIRLQRLTQNKRKRENNFELKL